MPDDENALDRPKHRARFGSLRVVLLVEFAAVALMVAGSLWLIQAFRQDLEPIGSLLNYGQWLLVLVVSGFGTAASLGPYYIGQRGTAEVLQRFPQLEGDRWERIESAFQSWGAPTLVLTGIPGIGMVLIVSAGALGIKRNSFLVWTFAGKTARNWLLLLGIIYGFRLFGQLGSS